MLDNAVKRMHGREALDGSPTLSEWPSRDNGFVPVTIAGKNCLCELAFMAVLQSDQVTLILEAALTSL